MLDLTPNQLKEVANAPTAHSFLAKVLKLSPSKQDSVEEKLGRWYQSLSEDLDVRIILNRTFPFFLESEALTWYRENNLDGALNLPEIVSAEDAAYLAQMDHNGTLSEDSLKAAVSLMEKIKAGEIKPPRGTLTPAR